MHAIGVDIGGTKIAAGVVDEEGRILAQSRLATDPSDADSVDAGVIEVVRELADSYQIGAIGLAAPGLRQLRPVDGAAVPEPALARPPAA